MTFDEPGIPQQSSEQSLKDALTPFGWTCTDEFWNRYYTDAWVFNLANAVERLTAENNELRSQLGLGVGQ